MAQCAAQRFIGRKTSLACPDRGRGEHRSTGGHRESRPKLLDQRRLTMRLRHRSLRTAQVYVGWTRRFILFHHKRHPKEMGAEEIRAFLTHLAVHDRVAASTHNVALHALLFLYRHVLTQECPSFDPLERAKRPRRVPTVCAREEVAASTTTRLRNVMSCCPSPLRGRRAV